MHLTDQAPTSPGIYWWAPLEAPEVAVLVRVRIDWQPWSGGLRTVQFRALEDPPEPWRLPRRNWLAVSQIEGSLWSSEPLPEAPTEVRTSSPPGTAPSCAT